jgi:RimJ/RimL family protein N-acetyltransferase
MPGHRVTWGDLVATEPTPAEVEAAAPDLAAAYNDPHNAPLMGHVDALTAADVVDHYGDLDDEGAHAFLLQRHGELVGDGDFRDLDEDAGDAEFAIMVATRASQGKGLGTRFAIMLHAFGFGVLGLRRVYVAIVPHNAGSLRLFEKLGYRRDDSERAREFADDPNDRTFSLDRATFEELHAAALAEIEIAPRA